MSRFFRHRRSSRIRVGFDGRWLNGSGVGTYVRNVIPALASRPEVELIVYANGAQLRELTQRGYECRQVDSGLYSPISQFTLARRAVSDGLDLFHSPFYVIPALTPCPVVCTIHDLELLTLPESMKLKRWQRSIITIAHRLAIERCSVVLTDSQSSASEVRSSFPKSARKLVVAPLGPSFSASPATASGADSPPHSQLPYLLSLLGAQVKKKNVNRLLVAYSHYRKRGGPHALMLVGDNTNTLAALEISGTELDHLGVILTGRVTDSSLRQLIAGAVALVHVSLHEGFGLPVLDALSAGTPVVTSSNSGMAEVASDAALLIDPYDVEAIADALLKISTDVQLRSTLRDLGLRRAAQFSWERCAAQTLTAYFRALSVSSTEMTPSQPIG